MQMERVVHQYQLELHQFAHDGLSYRTATCMPQHTNIRIVGYFFLINSYHLFVRPSVYVISWSYARSCLFSSTHPPEIFHKNLIAHVTLQLVFGASTYLASSVYYHKCSDLRTSVRITVCMSACIGQLKYKKNNNQNVEYVWIYKNTTSSPTTRTLKAIVLNAATGVAWGFAFSEWTKNC